MLEIRKTPLGHNYIRRDDGQARSRPGWGCGRWGKPFFVVVVVVRGRPVVNPIFLGHAHDAGFKQRWASSVRYCFGACERDRDSFALFRRRLVRALPLYLMMESIVC